MNTFELLGPFERLLQETCPPDAVRRIEAEGRVDELFLTFNASGFLDALVPEKSGGAGLTWRNVGPLFQALGRYAVPAPVAETIVARSFLARSGQCLPKGWINLSPAQALSAPNVPQKLALVEHDGMLRLTPTIAGSIPLPEGGIRPILAVIRSCAIAGAADRILALTLRYAKERIQFGKPISKQQVIQQQIAVLAERAVACRLAAEVGCAGIDLPTPTVAAIAKHITSAAAGEISGIAHAVHGAIGLSEEFDLQLYTRRLHVERLADGSESYWAHQLGAARLAEAALPTIEFIRNHLP